MAPVNLSCFMPAGIFAVAAKHYIDWLSILVNKYICIYLHTRALSGQHSDPSTLSALEPFFGDFSAARPRFVARLAPSDSPRSRGPCPRAGPPSPRPSRSASEVARSRLPGLPHAPHPQPCFFTTTSLLGSSYNPAVAWQARQGPAAELRSGSDSSGAAAAAAAAAAIVSFIVYRTYCCAYTAVLIVVSRTAAAETWDAKT